jgi:hypothetical protein
MFGFGTPHLTSGSVEEYGPFWRESKTYDSGVGRPPGSFVVKRNLTSAFRRSYRTEQLKSDSSQAYILQLAGRRIAVTKQSFSGGWKCF